tara:strand:+ start:47390 stop:47893 length:504 start_codon:yes stop_codon:yes gene_type:complete
MKSLKFLLIIFAIPLLAFTTLHKYYISVTQIDYIQEKQSVQITTRIFIDDIEKLLKDKYDANIELGIENESKTIDLYIETYLKEKIKIKINNENAHIVFIGKEYDADIMRCYLEIVDVKSIKSISIINQVLFNVFESQQNIIKTKINSKQKSFILTVKDANAVLNFN